MRETDINNPDLIETNNEVGAENVTAEREERQWERVLSEVRRYKIQPGGEDLKKEEGGDEGGEVELFTIIEESEMTKEQRKILEELGCRPVDSKVGLGLDEAQAERLLGKLGSDAIGGSDEIKKVLGGEEGGVHQYILDYLRNEKKNHDFETEKEGAPDMALERHNEEYKKGILEEMEDYLFKHLSPEITASLPPAALAFQFTVMAMQSSGIFQKLFVLGGVASGLVSLWAYKDFKNRRNTKK